MKGEEEHRKLEMSTQVEKLWWCIAVFRIYLFALFIWCTNVIKAALDGGGFYSYGRVEKRSGNKYKDYLSRG